MGTSAINAVHQDIISMNNNSIASDLTDITQTDVDSWTFKDENGEWQTITRAELEQGFGPIADALNSST